MTKLIKNTTIVTMNEDMDIIEGSILLDNGVIKEIFPPHSCSEPDIHAKEVIDGREMLVIPGMTNAHYHSYSNLLKGTTSNLPLEIWSLYTVAFGHSLDDEDIELAVLLGAIEMIKSGVTSCIDHFPHIKRSQAALKAYEKTGMRVGFAPMMHDVPDHHFLPVQLPIHISERFDVIKPISVQEMKHFYNKLFHDWHGRNEKINILIGPNAPQRCSVEMLNLCKRLSDEKEAMIHTHLLETRIQKEMGDKTFPRGIVGRLEHQNLLSSKLSVAHSVWLEDREINLLGEKEISMVHNPVSNMMLGSGFANIAKYLKQGINMALGTDSSNCGISHNLFETMRIAVMVHRTNNPSYEEWVQPNDVMKMATVGGAHLLGESKKRGKIQTGYDADLVLINKHSSTFTTHSDVISQLVFYENGSSIDSVLVKGEWVLKNKKVVSFDESEVIRKVQERSHLLLEKCQPALELAMDAHPYFANMYQSVHKILRG